MTHWGPVENLFTTPTSRCSGQSRWVQHSEPFNHLNSIFGSQKVVTFQVVNDLEPAQFNFGFSKCYDIFSGGEW